MAVFHYEALDNYGNLQNGLIHAADSVEARQRLRQKGMHVSALSEETGVESETTRLLVPWLGAAARKRQIAIFARQLGTLVNAGVPLVSALASVEEQLADENLKKIIVRIRERVSEGLDFSECLREYPDYFTSVFLNLVRTGELSGNLEQNLFYLADYLEKQIDFQDKFKAALYYPVFMLALSGVIIFFLLTYMVPSITGIFNDWGQELPALTRGLMWLSDIFRDYWYLLILGLGALYELVRRLLRRPAYRLKWDKIKWRLPIWGPLEQRRHLAAFSRTLGLLLTSGMPLLRGLELTSKMIDNLMLAEVVKNAVVKVSQGGSLARVLRQSKVVPPLVLQMIATGEESGSLEELLLKTADFYDHEVETALVKFTSLLEPVLILVMAIIVGTAVVAIILPIMELNQVIS